METRERSSKSLLNTMRISDEFGVEPAQVMRTFSFGLKPTKIQRECLERWRITVEDARQKLYGMMYTHFQRDPKTYLAERFSYETFFKGVPVLDVLRATGDQEIVSSPVLAGLREELEGTMRSFSSNHLRLFKEVQDKAQEYLASIEKNSELLSEEVAGDQAWQGIVATLRTHLRVCADAEYDAMISDFGALKAFRNYLAKTNALAGSYNYELNQILPHLASEILRDDAPRTPKPQFLHGRITALPTFPVAEREEAPDANAVIAELEGMAKTTPDTAEVIAYIQRMGPKIKRPKHGTAIASQQRVAHYYATCLREAAADPDSIAAQFLASIDRATVRRRAEYRKKPFNNQNRAKYLDILSLRATLANPDERERIQLLRSTAVGRGFAVRPERITIPFSGFSWTSGGGNQKPQYGITLARDDKWLYACIAASQVPFITKGKNDLQFLRPSGGGRTAEAKPKEIAWIPGSFNEHSSSGAPLKLSLHFGKSQARRMLTNSSWGLLSENPRVFLNNARLVFKRKNPRDPWQYFLHVTMSGKPAIGYKNFSDEVRMSAHAVIGINRGEVNPLAFSVVSIPDGKVVERGLLGREEYTMPLLEYRRQISEYQSRFQIPPKHLRAKVSRLQKTTMESALAKIHSLVAFHRGVIAIEKLDGNFRGMEQTIIPKKTYLSVMQKLQNILTYDGVLRIDEKKGNLWGGMIALYPGGVSRICTQCETAWLSRRPEKNGESDRILVIPEIVEDAIRERFTTLDCDAGTLDYGTEVFLLNREWIRGTPRRRNIRREDLHDLERTVRRGESEESKRLLSLALDPQPRWGVFFCHRCGFQDQTDVLAATNLARRAMEFIHR